MEQHEHLICRDVQTHNLKHLNVSLPLKQWIAVTGVSGSGKSSLVFDTIYAESQRRFLETLGTYERQFLQGLPQGDFGSIDNLPASVALKQSNKTGDPRSVVATAADVADSFRTLFLAFIEDSCTQCGHAVRVHQSKDVLAFIESCAQHQADAVCYVCVPYVLPVDPKQQRSVLGELLKEGYTRLFVDGQLLRLDTLPTQALPPAIEIVLDAIEAGCSTSERINRVETLWSQVSFSTRFSVLWLRSQLSLAAQATPFYVQPFCDHCQKSTNIIRASDLNWQSVLGACPACHGLGNVPILDEAKIVPNPRLSLQEGAIKPWNTETFEDLKKELLVTCKKNGIPTDQPYGDLLPAHRDFVWKGVLPGEGGVAKKIPKKEKYLCVEGFFAILEQERYKSTARILLAKYRKYVTCVDCGGDRVGPVGRHARCFGKTFPQVFQCEIQESLSWLKSIGDTYPQKMAYVREIYEEVLGKLTILVELGLGSASLFRRCKTLSGGEYQRVLLTRVIGNGLTDALYVLDEPSVGLGKAEIPSLIACLRKLRDLGNTVLMVEHDVALVRAADVVVELGPGGGSQGGMLVPLVDNTPACFRYHEGPLEELKRLSLIASGPTPQSLTLTHFSALNCHDLTAHAYLGKLNVITGPSGAGKSTLLMYGFQAALDLYQETGLCQRFEPDLDARAGVWQFAVPADFLKTYTPILVEQKALHRTITSVPATLLGLLDPLRKLFAQTPEAKLQGLTVSDFSFNGGGGCPTCGGKGVVQDDLFFLGQVEKTCPDCLGCRYRPQVRDVACHGKTMPQWLASTLQDCFTAFQHKRDLQTPLRIACELGLGHLSLGMPTSLLSGGEAQRLRIAGALCKSNQRLVCLLDEPTRGLSEWDVSLLLSCLLRLTAQGHTFIVVEHHELFQTYADYLMEMGPGSGSQGGRLVKAHFNTTG